MLIFLSVLTWWPIWILLANTSGETEFEKKCLYSMAMNMSLRYCIMLKRLVKAHTLIFFSFIY